MALQAVLMQGLAEHVKDELAARNPPDNLNDRYALVIWLDNNLREYHRDRQSLYHASPQGPGPSNFSCPLDDSELERSKSEPIQIAVANLLPLWGRIQLAGEAVPGLCTTRTWALHLS